MEKTISNNTISAVVFLIVVLVGIAVAFALMDGVERQDLRCLSECSQAGYNYGSTRYGRCYCSNPVPLDYLETLGDKDR